MCLPCSVSTLGHQAGGSKSYRGPFTVSIEDEGDKMANKRGSSAKNGSTTLGNAEFQTRPQDCRIALYIHNSSNKPVFYAPIPFCTSRTCTFLTGFSSCEVLALRSQRQALVPTGREPYPCIKPHHVYIRLSPPLARSYPENADSPTGRTTCTRLANSCKVGRTEKTFRLRCFVTR